MSDARSVREAVDLWNDDCRTEALIDLGVGLVSCGGVFGVLFALAWMVSLSVSVRHATTIASLATGTFMIVAGISAYRGTEPLDGLESLSDAESARDAVTRATARAAFGLRGGAAVGVLSAHGRAGIASLLIDGPRRLIDGVRNIRRRIVVEPELAKRAQKLLRDCDRQPTIQADPRIVFLLVQLLRVEEVQNKDTFVLRVRAKGRDLLERRNGATDPAG